MRGRQEQSGVHGRQWTQGTYGIIVKVVQYRMSPAHADID